MHQPTFNTSTTSFVFGDPDFLSGTDILAIVGHSPCDLDLWPCDLEHL